MIDLPTASLTIVLLNAGEGNMGGEYIQTGNPGLHLVALHVCGVGGYSTKVTEIIIRTISAPVANFTTS